MRYYLKHKIKDDKSDDSEQKELIGNRNINVKRLHNRLNKKDVSPQQKIEEKTLEEKKLEEKKKEIDKKVNNNLSNNNMKTDITNNITNNISKNDLQSPLKNTRTDSSNSLQNNSLQNNGLQNSSLQNNSMKQNLSNLNHLSNSNQLPSRNSREVSLRGTKTTPRTRHKKSSGTSAGFAPGDELIVKLHHMLMEQIDSSVAAQMPREKLVEAIGSAINEIVNQNRMTLTMSEQRLVTDVIVDDMIGLGPLEKLLHDPTISDILVNGPDQVYIEREGKMVASTIKFRNKQHLINIAQRIAGLSGRRVDEAQPLADSRLQDGSRVHLALPPVASNGPYISIRKFVKQKIILEQMIEIGSLSDAMAKILRIAAICRLNIIISGGTGAGKTTLLNALSEKIHHNERIITIEDTLELQLQQPHVIRLECRHTSIEGITEIDAFELVRNSLRMRPDRIIIGEVRSREAFDMLQAMNTGHDGSMTTIHANNTRDALTRLENMLSHAGLNLSNEAIRQYIASAVNLIIHVSRLRDGRRVITGIEEITGMERNVISSQKLFSFEYSHENEEGEIIGQFKYSGLRPGFYEKARYYGLGEQLEESLGLL